MSEPSDAPLLDLPMLESQQATGLVLEVARVATAGDLTWVETTDPGNFGCRGLLGRPPQRSRRSTHAAAADWA